MTRFYYYTFILYFQIFRLVISVFLRRKTVGVYEGAIAALPYYPTDWPGGEDRIAAWKSFFEMDGVSFDVFWAWDKLELQRYFSDEQKDFQFGRYWMFFKLTNRRLSILSEIIKYKTIWIQRAYIPLFPFKDAYFERFICKMHPNVVFDFYDADYESNFDLVMGTIRHASKVTVASEFLKNRFQSYNPNVYFIRFALKETEIIYKANEIEKIRIGWMGSPQNALNLKEIEDDLFQIEEDCPNVEFTFVCRNLPELKLKRIKHYSFDQEGFNYEGWLQSLDIGIVPFISQTERIKAKISMKGLEFMANNVALVCSPHVHSDKLVHNESFLLTHKDEWLNNIRQLIDNKELRLKLSARAKLVYINYHTYQMVYSELKKALCVNV